MSVGSREYPARPLVGIGVVLLRQAPAGPLVLLIKRGRPPAAGQWSFPGGAQRLGETAEDAARRELREETGLSASSLRLAGHADSIHRDEGGQVRYHYTILDFTGLWQGGEAVAGGDAAAVCWAGEADFERLGLAQGLREMFGTACRVLSEGKESVLF